MNSFPFCEQQHCVCCVGCPVLATIVRSCLCSVVQGWREHGVVSYKNFPVTPHLCNENIDFLEKQYSDLVVLMSGVEGSSLDKLGNRLKHNPKAGLKSIPPIMHQQVTHMTWKGQLGVWRNLSSLMLLWGTVLRVERHQHLSTRLMGLAEINKHKHSKILYQVPGTGHWENVSLDHFYVLKLKQPTLTAWETVMAQR